METPHLDYSIYRRFWAQLRASFVLDDPIRSTKELVSLASEGGLELGFDYPDIKALYDLAEIALNLYVLQEHFTFESYENPVPYLERLERLLPVQTERSKTQLVYQQFNTPLSLAYAMCRLGRLNPYSTVLEPSAGLGSIAVVAALQDPQMLVVNEFHRTRFQLLQALGYASYNEDAKYLPHLSAFRALEVDLILMNPPFAKDSKLPSKKAPQEVTKHIDAGLATLITGGQLVAIVPGGLSLDSVSFQKWWKHILSSYTLQANFLLDGELFHRKGTTFATRLIVIDKVSPPSDHQVMQQSIASASELVALSHHFSQAHA